MKFFFRIIGNLCICAAFIAVGAAPAYSQDNLVRAKIGILIKSKDSAIRAKKKERIRTGDRLRIYALPEKPSYVYVIHTDTKTATLLNAENQRIENGPLTLPSLQNYYEIDGQSSTEIITIVCSPEKLTALIELFTSGQADQSAWASAEKNLVETSRIDLTHTAEKPFSIAGNVRGGAVAADPFIEKLQTSSGKSLVVSRYEFRVKK